MLAIAANTSSRLYGVSRGGRSAPILKAISASTPRYRCVIPRISHPLHVTHIAGIGANAGVASGVAAPTFQPPIASYAQDILSWMKYASSSVVGRKPAGRSAIGLFVLRASSSKSAASISSASRGAVIMPDSLLLPASTAQLAGRRKSSPHRLPFPGVLYPTDEWRVEPCAARRL